MAFVTFIIPTIGRDTLKRAIDSLKAQIVNDWKAIVIADELMAEPGYLMDERIDFIPFFEKLGEYGKDKRSRSGLVRNKGLELVTSEWVAFLDDDDVVRADYVKFLMMYSEEFIPIVVFRAHFPNGDILPPISNRLDLGMVGISFAVRMNLINTYKIRFNNSGCEDWQFLNLCKARGKYVVSPYITYDVRPKVDS